MRAIRNMLLLAVASASLAACGTALEGNGQSILIETSPSRHASCLVESARGSWNLPATPQHLSISRGRGPLTVTCDTTDGWHGTAQVGSHAGAVPVAGAVVVGGMSSAAIDAHTGALWTYPSRVVVQLSPRSIIEVPDAGVRAVERAATPSPAAEPRHVRRRAPSLRGPVAQPHK